MMKRSVLALAVSLSLIPSLSNAAEIYNKDGNKLDLYGRVAAKHLFSKDKDNDGDKTYVRLGFKGETQINSQLTGFGQWEYNIQANHAESQGDKGNKTRLGFAGLKFAEYGSLDYGRNYGVVYDALAYTDMFPEFGGDSMSFTDNYMTGRSTGLLTYRNSNFFGLVEDLNIALQYQGNNDEGASTDTNIRSIQKANGDGYGLSVDYQNIAGSGIGAAASFSSSNRTLGQKTLANSAGGDKAQAWVTALKYDANQVYLAAMYGETLNMTPYKSLIANKAQNIELVAQYQFENGIRPSLGYVQSKGKNLIGVEGGDADLLKYFDIGVTYYINKNLYTYVDYQINQLNDDNKLGLSTDDVVAAALVYRF
ncbi:porin [Yersinia ruckeri]|uniref:Outer membrane porin protein n=1 Tax=Yersinia ruckeri TaxID=29486 RepID=A0A085U893_YERRU|nr:porin [Yersinia ruckeri]AKA37029.1 porin [Yersinia ruckeri]ARZ01259.1 outer membrane porin protein [Yersinia ruckeri]AUQ43317.1 phosphoporin PhoE [Yersinia ruckeri]EEP98881.1 Outer membrane protein C [Yersinia ruckeri ATCC 29473]KFE39406.1 outer membrane porin protein C [Yersinia ruckeri]